MFCFGRRVELLILALTANQLMSMFKLVHIAQRLDREAIL